MELEINRLGFNGMEKVTITVDDFPTEILKVDDWFSPNIGELCFNHNGNMDIVKDIFIKKTMGKPYIMVSFKNNTDIVSLKSINRIEVLEGKVFIFNNKVYVHQEALDGGYIEKIAKKLPITEYEYKFGE
jgi:hypothetical protein